MSQISSSSFPRLHQTSISRASHQAIKQYQARDTRKPTHSSKLFHLKSRALDQPYNSVPSSKRLLPLARSASVRLSSIPSPAGTGIVSHAINGEIQIPHHRWLRFWVCLTRDRIEAVLECWREWEACSAHREAGL